MKEWKTNQRSPFKKEGLTIETIKYYWLDEKIQWTSKRVS